MVKVLGSVPSNTHTEGEREREKERERGRGREAAETRLRKVCLQREIQK